MHDGKSQHFFDLPNKSGLASSSAYTVGLLRVCTDLDKVSISKLATTWEQDKLNGNVGSQDQYICALGGFHLLRFYAHGIKDKVIDQKLVSPLQDYLMLFDTHQYRRAGDVIASQMENIKSNTDTLNEMAKMVDEGYAAIKSSDYKGFGQMLDITWTLKKGLSDSVSSPLIDAIYSKAINAGAIGGKILGGGGGGFMVFLVEPDKQESVKKALVDLTFTPFRFEQEGTTVLYRDA